jgi:thioredoxin reductase (NADPH)
LLEHDLFRKPVPTFRDHALGRVLCSNDGTDRPQSLATSVPGVFAVGDVRAGSVKRVGAAIGEGAAGVPQIHAFLENLKAPAAQPLHAVA